jgi:ribokinase
MTVKLTVVGSINYDLIAQASRLPLSGETVMGGRFQTAPGGKGANQAVAAARLGAQVGMVGQVGADSYSQAVRSSLVEAGVDTTYVRTNPETHTGVALITLVEGGQNSIVVCPGANWTMTPADVDAAAPAISGADMVLLQLENRPEVVRRAAELAARQQVPVLLNPAPARSLPAELLAQVDYLVPNESEAALLTGQAVFDPDTARLAAEMLHRRGVAVVVITLGARGALLSTTGRQQHVPAFPVTVVDTTAAGDAFIAGLGLAIASGRTLAGAVRFAAAAGALATTKLGAQPSLPPLAAVERLLETTRLTRKTVGKDA